MSAKDSRLYGKFTLDFPDSPKIAPLSDAAFRALVEMTLYSRRMLTDGFIAERLALARWGQESCQELATNAATNPSLIKVENGYQIHDFADHQSTRADIERISEARKTAGRRGGLAKAKQRLEQTASKIYPETETENRDITTKDSSDASRSDDPAQTVIELDTTKTNPETYTSIYPQAFEQWWQHYPRKDAKKTALEAWKRATKRATKDELIAGAIRYADDPNREPRFTKQPATWLGGDCWLSDQLPAANNGTTVDWDSL